MFFAEDQNEINDDARVRGFTKVRELLKDFENDSAFDISVFEVESDTSRKLSDKYIEEQKDRPSNLTEEND